MNRKILFICKKRCDNYNHATYGLHNASRAVSLFLQTIPGFDSSYVFVQDGNEIDKFVTQYNPDIVFLEAIWATAEKLEELLLIPRHSKRKWVIYIHSNMEFLAHEGIAFEFIRKYEGVATKFWNKKLIYLAFNSKRAFDAIQGLTILPTLYLPNVYHYCKFYRKEIPLFKDRDDLFIGAFGAIRPFKNHLNELIASVKFANSIGKRLVFFVNGTRLEQGGNSVLRNLVALLDGTIHKIEVIPWQNDQEIFYNILRQMDISLQVSLSETFNNVGADSISVGVPTVGSAHLEYLSELSQANPYSVDDICEKMKTAYYNGWLTRWNKRLLNIIIQRNELIWTKTIYKLC
jgi:hypothetical protein